MVHEFPSKGSFYDIAVASDSPQLPGAISALESRVAADPLFVDEPPTIKSADGVTVIRVATPYGEASSQARDGLKDLRSHILPRTVGAVPGAQTAVGGVVAANADYSAHQQEKLPLVIGFVLAATFLIMLVTFRSVVVALTSIAVNLLSAAAAFGVLVGVFQHSWAEGLLSFHSSGAIVAWIPLFLFAVLFGLSMDYHVFVVSRIREAAAQGMPIRDAVEQGVTRSAGVVTSAAVVMVSVFAVFATLSMIEMKEIGVGLAAAVLIDALVVRIVVLPSAMVLLGRANWWPSHVGRRATAEAAPRTLVEV
jgi:RND superfamily putative drug exporter